MKALTKQLPVAVLAAAALLGFADRAHAATIIVDPTNLNGSFESQVITDNGGQWSNTWIADRWSTWGAGAFFLQSVGGVQDGSQFAGIGGNGTSGGGIYLDRSTINHTIGANTTYTLTVWARVNDGGDSTATISIYGNDGVSYLQQTTTALSGLSTTWQQFTASFTTGASGGAVGTLLQLELDRTGSTNQVWFDNVVVTAEAVPEPSSAVLGGLGLLALLRRRR